MSAPFEPILPDLVVELKKRYDKDMEELHRKKLVGIYHSEELMSELLRIHTYMCTSLLEIIIDISTVALEPQIEND